MSKLLTFQKYNDPAVARAIGERLAAAGIEYEIESQQPHVDPVIIGNTPEFSIDLMIAPEDFIRARAALESYYEEHLEGVSPDYYLFDFTDQELLEILTRPDEWGVFDYVLARKLLTDHGLPMTQELTDSLKAKRLAELAKPEDSGLGGVVSGYIAATKKKTLPDGSQVPAYSPAARRRGWIVFIIGAIAVALFLFLLLRH
ncbi:MAG TPA: hypothetical protein VG605_17840 [Puia sp.]|jgi:hypothetical protein|nr:hypothetical protein [Puia sp.]